MNRLELLIMVVVATMVFILALVGLLTGVNGTRLGIALMILGAVIGYMGKAMLAYMKKK